MKPQIIDQNKKIEAKVSAELTKKYRGEIIFKEKFERVSAYFKGRDLEKEIENLIKK